MLACSRDEIWLEITAAAAAGQSIPGVAREISPIPDSLLILPRLIALAACIQINTNNPHGYTYIAFHNRPVRAWIIHVIHAREYAQVAVRARATVARIFVEPQVRQHPFQPNIPTRITQVMLEFV